MEERKEDAPIEVKEEAADAYVFVSIVCLPFNFYIFQIQPLSYPLASQWCRARWRTT